MTKYPAASAASNSTCHSLADMLFPLRMPHLRSELETYRKSYEAIHGATDLTKRYTSLWPINQQSWLLENAPREYYNGLPPFVKAYLKGKMELAAQVGALDDMPDAYIKLFLSKNMNVDSDRQFGR